MNSRRRTTMLMCLAMNQEMEYETVETIKLVAAIADSEKIKKLENWLINQFGDDLYDYTETENTAEGIVKSAFMCGVPEREIVKIVTQ